MGNRGGRPSGAAALAAAASIVLLAGPTLVAWALATFPAPETGNQSSVGFAIAFLAFASLGLTLIIATVVAAWRGWRAAASQAAVVAPSVYVAMWALRLAVGMV